MYSVYILVAYTTDRLNFQWDKVTPVEITDGLELPQFILDDYNFADCTKTYSTGIHGNVVLGL